MRQGNNLFLYALIIIHTASLATFELMQALNSALTPFFSPQNLSEGTVSIAKTGCIAHDQASLRNLAKIQVYWPLSRKITRWAPTFQEVNMSNNIAGKIVVITGASSGLGEATARHLSELGAVVVLGARRIV